MSLKIPNEKTLELMVLEEEKRRKSKEYIDACSEVKDIPNGWLTIVTENMQREIVKMFGFTGISEDIALDIFRRAQYIYPENKIFKEIPLQVRLNKSSIGKYIDGDNIPKLNLFDRNKNKISLESILCDDKINLIISGSHT